MANLPTNRSSYAKSGTGKKVGKDKKLREVKNGNQTISSAGADTKSTKIRGFPVSGTFDRLGYSSEIHSRLGFLQYILVNSKLTLSRNKIINLWDLLHNHALNALERERCFLWFDRAVRPVESGNYPMFDRDTCKFVFEEIIMKGIDATTLGAKGYTCFERYFTRVNKWEGRLRYDGYAWTAISFPLIGIEVLWNIILNVSENQKFLDNAIRLLNNCHQYLGEKLLREIGEIRLKYIHNCLHRLSERRKARDEVGALRCLRLINFLMDVSESRGIDLKNNLSCQPHGTRLLGRQLTIIVTNPDRHLSRDITRLELDFHSNKTLWQVREALGENFRIDPTMIDIRSSMGILLETWNSRSLHELGLGFRRILMLEVSKHRSSHRSRLVDNGSMTPRLEEAVKDIFNRYSKIKGQRHLMGKDEIHSYLFACGMTFKQIEEDTRAMLRVYGDTEYIDLIGFHQFVNNLCNKREDDVWESLTSHGYRYDLRQIEDVRKQERKHFSNVDTLPRTLIVNDDKAIKQLFGALEEKASLAKHIWNLLQRLPTVPHVLSKLLSLKEEKKTLEVDWSKLIPSNINYHLLYHLQVIEILMTPVGGRTHEQKKAVSVASSQIAKNKLKDNETMKWRRCFLTNGGSHHLYKILMKILNISDPKSPLAVDVKPQAPSEKKTISNPYLDDASVNTVQLLMKIFREFSIDSCVQSRGIKFKTIRNAEIAMTSFMQNTSLATDTLTVSRKSYRLDSLQSKYLPKDTGTPDKKAVIPREHYSEGYEINTVYTRGLELEFMESLLKKIDWAALQGAIIRSLLDAISSSSYDSLPSLETLVLTGFSLWCLCMLIEPVDFFTSVQSMMKISPLTLYRFIASGPSQGIRALTAGAIFATCRLAARVPSITKKLIASSTSWPHTFFIEWLCCRIFDKSSSINHHCDEQFLLLSHLLKISQAQTDRQEKSPIPSNSSMGKLLKQEPGSKELQSSSSLLNVVMKVIDFLRTYESQESPDSNGVDPKLVGMLDILTDLFKQPSLAEYKHKCASYFIPALFRDFLFSTSYSVDVNSMKNDAKAVEIETKLGKSQAPKCCAPKTRRSCFSLLAELINGCDENYAKVLEQLQELHRDGKSLNGWNNEVRDLTISDQRFVGLKNMGATCYMNSVLQQLFMTTRLRYGLLSARVAQSIDSKKDMDPMVTKKAPKSTTDKDTGGDRKTVSVKAEVKQDKSEKMGDLLKQMQIMFSFLMQSQRNVFDMDHFCSVYKDPDGKQIHRHTQCDAQEFLSNFLSILEKQLDPTPQKNLIKASFMGTFCDHMINLEDGRIMQEKIEDFLTISLQVQGLKSLRESLQSFVTGEQLQKPRCRKAMCLGRLPNTLIFHLNRFTINMKTFQHEKLHHRFEFPMNVDLYPYTREGLKRTTVNISGENSKKKTRLNPITPLDKKRYLYHLVGIVVHKGTAEAGHYYSIIRPRCTRDGKPQTGGWVKFDDNHTTEFDPDPTNFAKESFGEGVPTQDAFNMYSWDSNFDPPKRPTAYMLVYERDHPLSDLELSQQVREMIAQEEKSKKESKTDSMKTVAQEEQSEKESKKDSTKDDKMAVVAAGNSSKVYIEKAHSKDISYNFSGMTEKDMIKKFCGVSNAHTHLPPSEIIPKAIAEMISIDNRVLMTTVQLYSPDYFNFVERVFLQVGPERSHLKREEYEAFVLLVFRFMMTVIARSKQNSSFQGLANHLSSLIREDSKLAAKILDAMISNRKEVTTFALKCRTSTIQRSYLSIVIRAIIVHARANYALIEQEAIRAMSQQALEKKDVEGAPACVRMLHILVSLINDVRDNWVRMKVFFSMMLGIVTEIPIVKSILIMSPMAKTKLIPDLLALCTCEYPAINSRINDQKFVRLLQFLASLIRFCDTPAKYRNLSDVKKQRNPKCVDYRNAGLNQKFITPKFIECHRYDRKAINDILCHWAHENKGFDAIDKLIDVLEKSTYLSVAPVFNLIRSILVLKDSLQKHRIDKFLGSEMEGLPYLIRKSTQQISASKHFLTLTMQEVINLGNTYDNIGEAMIKNKVFCNTMMECLKYNIEDDALAEEYISLAKKHGSSLTEMIQDVYQWDCAQCTFRNSPANSSCAMCGFKRFTEGQRIQAYHALKKAWRRAVILVDYTTTFNIRWEDIDDGDICSLPPSKIRELPKAEQGKVVSTVEIDNEAKAAAVALEGTGGFIAKPIPTPKSKALTTIDIHAASSHQKQTEIYAPKAMRPLNGLPLKRQDKHHSGHDRKSSVSSDKKQWHNLVEGQAVKFYAKELERWVDATIVCVNNKGKYLVNYAEDRNDWVAGDSKWVKPIDPETRKDVPPIHTAIATPLSSSDSNIRCSTQAIQGSIRSRANVPTLDPIAFREATIEPPRIERSRKHNEMTSFGPSTVSSIAGVTASGMAEAKALTNYVDTVPALETSNSALENNSSSLRAKFSAQISIMKDMGFSDERQMIESLQHAQGNVRAALEALLGGGMMS